MNEWKAALLTSGRRRAMPLALLPGVAHLKRTVAEAICMPEVQADAALLLADRFPSPAAVMMMDLSLEAEAFGAQVVVSDREVPFVKAPCLNSADDVDALCVPPVDAGRLPVYFKAAETVVRSLHTKPVFASCIGPVSLAARLIEISELMTSMMLEPEKIERLLEKCTDFLQTYISEYKRIGANGVLIAEPVAGLLSPELCEQFSSQYVRRIVRALQDDAFLVVLHNCGQTQPLLGSMEGTGAAALSLGNACDIADALARVKSDTLVLGNIDPVSVMQRGSEDDVRIAVAARLEQTAAFANHILSSGCDIPYGTPLANIGAMFAAVDEFNAKQGSARTA